LKEGGYGSAPLQREELLAHLVLAMEARGYDAGP
jgi:hypothetical protein